MIGTVRIAALEPPRWLQGTETTHEVPKQVLEPAWILDYHEHGPEEILGLIRRTVGSEDGVLVVRMATGNYLGNNLLTEIEKP